MTEMTAQCLKTYSLRIDGDGNILGRTSPHEDGHRAGEALDSMVRRYAHEHVLTYREALDRVLNSDDGEELLHNYNTAASTMRTADDGLDDPAEEVARKAHAHAKANGCSFSQAAHTILAKDSSLQSAYAGVVGRID